MASNNSALAQRLTQLKTRIAEAERRYAQRYRQPRENPERVVIEIAVDRLLGSVK